MPILLDGKIVRAARKQMLIERIGARAAELGKGTAGSTPCLAIVQVGNRSDSTSFINAKKKFAVEIGVKEIHIQIPESATSAEIISHISKLNADASVHGIIVQLPLPSHIDRDAVISAIDPKKDTDGLTPLSVNAWLEGRSDAVWPATARGIREMLAHYDISLFGKKVTVIGRSMLVGKPIAAMCLNENATVTVAHSRTDDLASFTRLADVVIVAIGKPQFIGVDHLRDGQVVVDVGINTEIDISSGGTGVKKLVGDVDFSSVKDTVSAISPVPGGVGQMTVLALFENLIDAWCGPGL